MLHAGANHVDGIPIEVIRKKVRRISIRIGHDGAVRLTVPLWWATLRQAETFLNEKLPWVRKTRAVVLSCPVPARQPVTKAELLELRATLGQLQGYWATRFHEKDVTWRLRSMKTQWGSCHFRKRVITYNTDLAHVPRELVEYVVVHELTHLVAHDHGPNFYRHMDERLPGWKNLRTRLNKRDFAAPKPAETPPVPEHTPEPHPSPPSEPPNSRLIQAEFNF